MTKQSDPQAPVDLDKSAFYEGPAKIGGVSFGFVRLQDLNSGSWAGTAVAPDPDAPGYKRFGIPVMPTVLLELPDGRQSEVGVTARELAGFDREALLGRAAGEAEAYGRVEWFLEIRGSGPLPARKSDSLVMAGPSDSDLRWAGATLAAQRLWDEFEAPLLKTWHGRLYLRAARWLGWVLAKLRTGRVRVKPVNS